MENFKQHTFFNQEISGFFSLQMNELIYYKVECHLMFERLLPHIRSGKLQRLTTELIDDSCTQIFNMINGFDIIRGNYLPANFIYEKLLTQLNDLDFSCKKKQSIGSDIAIADGLYKLLYNQITMLDMLMETGLILRNDNMLLSDNYTSATDYKDILKKIHVELLNSFVKDNLELYQ